MKTFYCGCGNKLFFENSLCLSCNRELGWCPGCNSMQAMEPDGNGGYICANNACRTKVVKCYNYQTFNVCNRMVADPGNGRPAPLCDYCQYTETIPDLNVPGNITKWYNLEVAKRRLLYLLDIIGLPYGTRAQGFELPLSFDFKEDVQPVTFGWLKFGQQEQVFTGHADGKITINIKEADPLEREKMRVSFGETQRTLIGHFRHEIGHYYWQLFVSGKDEEAFKAIFGDHNMPTYSQALESYYNNGPKANWASSYISAYATMHPWEDFAETFNTYLDMISVLDTAENNDLLNQPGQDLNDAQLEALLARYTDLSIKVNEVNRSLGLPDLLPETFPNPVMEKLRYIHHLIKKYRSQEEVSPPTHTNYQVMY